MGVRTYLGYPLPYEHCDILRRLPDVVSKSEFISIIRPRWGKKGKLVGVVFVVRGLGGWHSGG